MSTRKGMIMTMMVNNREKNTTVVPMGIIRLWLLQEVTSKNIGIRIDVLTKAGWLTIIKAKGIARTWRQKKSIIYARETKTD